MCGLYGSCWLCGLYDSSWPRIPFCALFATPLKRPGSGNSSLFNCLCDSNCSSGSEASYFPTFFACLPCFSCLACLFVPEVRGGSNTEESVINLGSSCSSSSSGSADFYRSNWKYSNYIQELIPLAFCRRSLASWHKELFIFHNGDLFSLFSSFPV